ncbi:C39 family peptidase [Weissella ceti]|uniref:C39 family peptidase n=1 Tax=Weissella ceti TaxID=759620 RepID=A0ABT3E4J7_9LACO|nr:C39 family peptidase [Weissella ceti]MCW0953290.1 C39 family peptidase [Weissella ceti]QVK12804.1 C39 family peptidase [Weissella ceti]
MNEKRHFKMYKQGKIWVTALAGLGALAMGAVSVEAAEINVRKAPIAAQTVKVESNKEIDTKTTTKSVSSKTPEKKNVEEGISKSASLDQTDAKATLKSDSKLESTSKPENDTKAVKKESVAEADKPVKKSEVKSVVKTAEKVTPKKTTSDAEKDAEKPVVKNGWHGDKYFKNGKELTGQQTINGKTYLFGADGKAKKGFQTVGKNKQYYDNNFVQRKNGYVNLDKNSTYYLKDGNAIQGVRKFKDSKGKDKIEVYNAKTHKQLRNTYYILNKNTKAESAYYLGADGRAIQGIRKYKDSKGKTQIETYNWSTHKQMRNAYYMIDKGTKTPTNYYLGNDGRAIQGIRKYKDSKGKTQIETYNWSTHKQMRNAYYMIDKGTKTPTNYYLGKDGRAIQGIRKYKDSKGKTQIETYNWSTHKQMRNAYYMIDKGTKTPTNYYLGKDGRAIQGIRKYKDSKGKTQIETYNWSTHKQMRNAYYVIDKDKKVQSAYYLGSNGRAIKGLRQFGNNVEYYDNNFKRVANKWQTVKNTRYHFGKNGKATEVLLNYKYYSQLQQGAPQGCEGASMQMALSHKGRYVPSLKEIYKKTGSGYKVSPHKGFYGNPFGNGGAVTETIFASALAKSYKHAGAADLTGAKKKDIIRELNRGNAIVTWADYSWRLTGAHSFHVMSIVGYNNGSFLIADPYAYGKRTLWVNQNTWEYVNSNTQTLGYKAPRSMNMVIR